MVEQCLRYDGDNIRAVYIYENYDITRIPADAFTGAAYLEVSCLPVTSNTVQCRYNAIHFYPKF